MERKINPTRQIATALIAAIPSFTYGIQIGWLSPMKEVLQGLSSPASNHISNGVVSWLGAALPLSAICGIPFFSHASDRFGRKASGVVVSLLSCLSWSLKLWYVTPTGLIVARVLAGLAAGGCFVVVPVYIREVAEDRCRGALVAMNMTLCKLGVIFVYAVGMSASYQANQAVYLAIAAAHCVFFSFMPESPNYLLKIGREGRAIKAISWLRDTDEDDEIVANEMRMLKEENKVFLETNQVTFISVVKDRTTFSPLCMVTIMMGMQTLSGCFALINYASDVFSRAGSAWSPNTLALLMGALQLVGSAATTGLIESCGRKIPLAISSLVVSISMAALATYFYADSDTVPWLPAAAICVCILAYGAGLAPVPFVYMAEVFTYQVRARMAGAAMAFSFFCSSMTVLFYAPVSDRFGPYVVFYAFSAISLLGFIYTIFCVPETKGKSLEEIQRYWKKDKPVFV